MTKYIPRKKTTFPFVVKGLNGKAISFDDELREAKIEAISYTNKTGRAVEIWKYVGRVER